jgi:hypothetical protein
LHQRLEWLPHHLHLHQNHLSLTLILISAGNKPQEIKQREKLDHPLLAQQNDKTPEIKQKEKKA